jgi:hypothetical protein
MTERSVVKVKANGSDIGDRPRLGEITDVKCHGPELTFWLRKSKKVAIVFLSPVVAETAGRFVLVMSKALSVIR